MVNRIKTILIICTWKPAAGDPSLVIGGDVAVEDGVCWLGLGPKPEKVNKKLIKV